MIHPERMPEAHHIATRITEADIVKQQRELDQQSANMLAANVYNATQREDIRKIGELLTGASSPNNTLDSDTSNKDTPLVGDEETN